MADDQGEARGVFGNLPDTRPGTRSPRRETTPEDGSPRPRTASEDGEGERLGEARQARQAPPPTDEQGLDERELDERDLDERGERGSEKREPDEPSPDKGGGLEDLAWAGVAVAAEAATIGVRLASRAMEALRRTDRR
jgi:hypothetical protein